MKSWTWIRLQTFTDQVRGVPSWLRWRYWPRRRFHIFTTFQGPLKSSVECKLLVEALSVDWFLFHCPIICGLDVITILGSILLFGTPCIPSPSLLLNVHSNCGETQLCFIHQCLPCSWVGIVTIDTFFFINVKFLWEENALLFSL